MQNSNHSVEAARSRWLTMGLPLAVCLTASVLAGNLLHQFWDRADHLWYSWQHDRNVHYLQGLALGMSVRSLDFASTFRELERMQTWGVLHPMLEGMVQFAAGPDHRLAVLPSLLGWVGCAVFGFLLARRMAGRFGNLAGLVTATFILASPGHHAFATDIMLESLGACFSLAVLYCYVRYVQEDTRRSGITLAATWALLFFLKSNYWVLVTISLTASELFRFRGAIQAYVRAERSTLAANLGRQLRSPLAWLIAASAALGIYVWKVGPVTIPLGSKPVTIRTFHGIVHFAFACVCFRTYSWWRGGGREWLATWPDSQRVLVLGATLPIAIWFLLPKRLGTFLWFISPANNSQPVEKYTPFYGFHFYWQGFVEDYLVAPWLAWLVVALTGIVLLRAGRLQRGSGAVLVFLLAATALTMHHPMLKNRHMHSWVAIYWVAAGVGFAVLLAGIARIHLYFAQGLGVAGAGALAIYFAPAFLDSGHAQEAGVQPQRPVFLEITDTFQPHVDPRQKLQILCSDTEAYGFRWACLEKMKGPRLVGLDIPGFNIHRQDPKVIREWLTNTKADALVLIDITNESRFWEGYTPVSLALLEEALREHAGFHCLRHWDVAKGEKVSLWTRASVAAVSEK